MGGPRLTRRQADKNLVQPSIFRRTEFWLSFLLAFHILIVLHAFQWYFYAIFAGDASHPFRYLHWSMELWYTRAALAPLTIYIALRYRFDLSKWFRYLVFYSAITLLIAALASILQVAVVGRLGTERFFSSKVNLADEHGNTYGQLTSFEKVIVKGWPHLTYNMFTCWMLIGLVQGIYYYRDAREKELEGSQLQAQLATMRLDMLRMQLRPHFLFNTLHAISTLIDEDPAVASEMLFRLSDLLRSILNDRHTQEISLREELRFVESHLAIEQVRFGDRLSTRISVASGLLDCAVPQFILQPLVENAIQHGIGKHAGTDLIEITASQQSGLLYLQVANTNSRLEQSPAECLQSGIGLSNTKLRLETLYNNDAQICLSDRTPSGVNVNISLPQRVLQLTQLQEPELQAL
jgi:two-component system LytT family sensor kinase